jgi:hypothetical protein
MHYSLMRKMRLPFIDSNVLYRGADFYYIYIKYTLEWMYHLILVNISGYTEGSTEVQRFTSIGVNNFAYNYRQLPIRAIFSGSPEWPLYTDLTVYMWVVIHVAIFIS